MLELKGPRQLIKRMCEELATNVRRCLEQPFFCYG